MCCPKLPQVIGANILVDFPGVILKQIVSMTFGRFLVLKQRGFERVVVSEWKTWSINQKLLSQQHKKGLK
jgi:hypothetical protein